MSQSSHYDVAIIGGGPAGATASSILRKYDPSIRVVILEKEKFPRDHVGESQLPGVSHVLHEMGAWDKVEAAGFPIKIGVSYTWGAGAETWDFEFMAVEDYRDEPRPARFEGQRRRLAFQVDRAIYDDILLRHAESMGVEVREETLVSRINRDGDRVTGFDLSDGSTVTADWYIDGSGAPGVLRRAMGITSWEPELLRNIAVWDYWTNAEWAVRIGVGATRVQVRSLPYGWLWFIPLGPTRTSIGLICPAEYYAKSGRKPEDLYLEAVDAEPTISRLTANATRENLIQSCKDWSHLADRLIGENWILTGEAAGFADPILAAGLNLTHKSALDAAYTILEFRRGIHEQEWLRERYDSQNRASIRQHINFAQFWYSSNGRFTDLQEHCAAIAREAGFRLAPEAAWRWLSQGGFVNENPEMTFFGSFDIATAKGIMEHLVDTQAQYCFNRFNEFRLNLKNVAHGAIGRLRDGQIEKIPCYFRGEARLPRIGWYRHVTEAIEHHADMPRIMEHWQKNVISRQPRGHQQIALSNCLMALEAMVTEGWVVGSHNPRKPLMEGGRARNIRSSEETRATLAASPDAPTVQEN